MLRVCVLFGETICLGVVVILLLNVMEVLSVAGGALLDRTSMAFQIMCVLCLRSKCAYKCTFYSGFCLCL